MIGKIIDILAIFGYVALFCFGSLYLQKMFKIGIWKE